MSCLVQACFHRRLRRSRSPEDKRHGKFNKRSGRGKSSGFALLRLFGTFNCPKLGTAGVISANKNTLTRAVQEGQRVAALITQMRRGWISTGACVKGPLFMEHATRGGGCFPHLFHFGGPQDSAEEAAMDDARLSWSEHGETVPIIRLKPAAVAQILRRDRMRKALQRLESLIFFVEK